MISALLDAGVGLLTGIGESISARKRQDAALKAQREEADRARAWNEKMAKWYNDEQRKNVADERAYNDPKAVMQRLKDSGLNPDLMYGQGAGNLQNTALADTAAVEGVAPPDVGSTIMGTPTVVESLMTGAAYRKMIAETNNIKEDTAKKKGEVQSLDLDNYTKAATQGSTIKMSALQVQLTSSQASYTDAQKSKIISEINDINQHVELLKAQVSETWSKTANLDAQTTATRMETILNSKRFELECEEFARRVRETDSKIALQSAESKAILVTMYAKLHNLNADTALKEAGVRLSEAQKTNIEHLTNSIDVHRDAAVFKLEQDQKYDDAQRIVTIANQATQSLYHISQVVSDWLPSPASIQKLGSKVVKGFGK